MFTFSCKTPVNVKALTSKPKLFSRNLSILWRDLYSSFQFLFDFGERNRWHPLSYSFHYRYQRRPGFQFLNSCFLPRKFVGTVESCCGVWRQSTIPLFRLLTTVYFCFCFCFWVEDSRYLSTLSTKESHKPLKKILTPSKNVLTFPSDHDLYGVV